MSCDEDKGENKIFLFLNNFSRGHENDAAISYFFFNVGFVWGEFE